MVKLFEITPKETQIAFSNLALRVRAAQAKREYAKIALKRDGGRVK